MLLRIAKFTKDFLLFLPLTFIINPFYKLYYFLSNFNSLAVWIRKHKSEFEYCDFYSPKRDYNKRYKLYEFIHNKAINNAPMHYFEYGVSKGFSFKWWLAANTNSESKFFGFDTFEGLPEDWSFYFKKGDMAAGLPDIQDPRAQFIKGIFQDSFIPFIDNHQELLKSNVKKVIHLDADLYTATHFVLSQFYRYLNKGDIILFDEFNVANHEYRAFKDFTDSFYIKLKPLGTVNNFFQVAFVVD